MSACGCAFLVEMCACIAVCRMGAVEPLSHAGVSLLAIHLSSNQNGKRRDGFLHRFVTCPVTYCNKSVPHLPQNISAWFCARTLCSTTYGRQPLPPDIPLLSPPSPAVLHLHDTAGEEAEPDRAVPPGPEAAAVSVVARQEAAAEQGSP